MAEGPSSKRPQTYPRMFCLHCDQYVSKSSWYLHNIAQASEKCNGEDEDEFLFTESDDSEVHDHSPSQTEGQSEEFDRKAFTSSSEDFSISHSSDLDTESESDCVPDFKNGDENSEVAESFKDFETDSDEDIELWSDSDSESSATTENDNVPPLYSTFMRIFVIFIFTWQSVFRISNIAPEMLLKFLHSIFSYLANEGTGRTGMKYIADHFPNSLAKSRALINLNRDDFEQYVCCAKCLAVYKFSECYERRGSQTVSKHCTSCDFPLHSGKSLRSTCDYPLLKQVKLARKLVLKPTKIYCYKSITDSLREMLARPGIAEMCEEWRDRHKVHDIYADVFDGKVWREFEEIGFFSLPWSYGLMLNTDWFQPFEHSIYSIGVIYIALLNLPRNIRNIRYNQENLIICGLIPGPKEPSNDINPFLEPLIEELVKLWKGVNASLIDRSVTLKAALLCVSCDSPAMRKTTGFVAHNARKGCFKCLKSFPTSQFGEKSDYSGFDRSKWTYRTNLTFKRAALKYKHSKTAKERSEICGQYGVRYTVLISLLYYDAIRFTIVDPMHNLLLGSAKTFIGLLKLDKILQTSEYEKIQFVIDNFVIPAGIGRLPHKVEHGFANLKAEEWKNWILIFSLVALKPLVDRSIYSLWILFVQACSLLRSRVITSDAIERADKLIHKYCCLFEEVFGKDKCYPNLHLHCHLKDCFLDHHFGFLDLRE